MLLPMMMALSWTVPASAWNAEQEYQKGINSVKSQQAIANNVNIIGGGECQLNDSYKKKLAQTAYTALYTTQEYYTKLVNKIRGGYLSESGACSHAYSSFKNMGFGKKDIQKADELEWTQNSWKGAGVVDSGQYKAKMNPNCKALIKQTEEAVTIGGEKVNMKDFNDYDLRKLRETAVEYDKVVGDMKNWAQKAKAGDEFTVTQQLVDVLQKSGITSKVFTRLVKLQNGGVAYVKSDLQTIKPAADGKCYESITYETTGEIERREIPCPKKKQYESKDFIWSYNSPDSFLKAVGDKTSQCVSALDEMIALRGNPNAENSYLGQRKIAIHALSILGGSDTECTCKKDENNNPTDSIDRSISLEESIVEENIVSECKTIAEYQAEMGEMCLTCGLMAKILGAAQKISEQSFHTLASGLIEVLGLAFLIFVAYTVLLTVASPETQKLSKFLTTILVQGGKVAIAALILANGEYLYDKAVNPILDSGVDFGLAFTNIAEKGNDNSTDASKDMDITLSEKIRALGASYTGNFDAQSNFLTTETLEKLVGANKNFAKDAAAVAAIGRCFICNATHYLGLGNLYIIPRMKMLITGLILLIFGIMIWAAIGFYILDCCLQLGLVVAMLPFFVACWPFKITNQYLKVGWNMLLNTFFNFVMMSVVIVTIALLVFGCLPDGLQYEMNANNVDAINNQLEIIGLGIVKLVVICMICLKLSSESGRLANKFAGGAKIKMGGELGGLAADTAKKAAVGNMGKQGKDGKRQGPGGALGTLMHGAGAVGGSIAEASGLKGWAKAKGQQIKGAMGGGRKTEGASFKQGGDSGGGSGGGGSGGGGSGGGSK